MKRYYYNRKRNLFVDEYNRLWNISHLNGCTSWSHVGYIKNLPDNFKYEEYYSTID